MSDNGARRLANALERARLASAHGDIHGLGEAIAAAACCAAAMTVRSRLPEGIISVSRCDIERFELPPGRSGATPPLWLDGLCCALAARDAAAVEILAQPAALPAVRLEAEHAGATVGTEAFWEYYGRALIALVREDAAAAEYARLAVESIATGATGVLDRDVLAAVDQRVLELIGSLAAGWDLDWRGSVAAAVGDFQRVFSGDGEVSLTSGYLPLGLLALSAVAFDRGLGLPEPTPYLPAAVVSGRPKMAATSMTIRFAQRTILSADEAHWFLDLQGYRRANRSHRLTEVGGEVLATYELPAAGGLPEATAEFRLTDSAAASERLALDAGQLLFLAEAFARECRSDSTLPLARQRILLSDAIGCVNAALERLPADGSILPRSAVPSVCGLQLYVAEPGRFRRARLEAYKEGLSKALAGYDDALSAQDPARDESRAGLDALDGEADARAKSLAVCAVVRAEVLLVIDALARDFDGEVQRTLRPRDGDYDKVFAGAAVAARARQAYEKLWSRGLNMEFPTSSQSEIDCDAAPAGMLAERNELSHRFPGGYLAIAKQLDPHRVWVRWQYRRPGERAGLAYDGLVWIDDHWSWFPKPYRYLGGRNTGPAGPTPE